ncbi:fasciclin domain-containing protein [Microbacterium sp. MC2]
MRGNRWGARRRRRVRSRRRWRPTRAPAASRARGRPPSYTVFAPNDRAFLRLVHDLTGTAPASEAEALTAITSTFSTDQIADILLYHVVAGKRLGPVRVITAKSLEMAKRRHRLAARVHPA